MLDYFKSKRAKKTAPSLTAEEGPVLTEEDEAWLQHITSQPERPGPELPPRPQDLPVAGEASGSESQIILRGDDASDHWTPGPLRDAQTQLMMGANEVPLPDSPGAEGDEVATKGKEKEDKKKSRFSFLRRSSSSAKRKAADEPKAAAASKSGAAGAGAGADPEAQKEADDLDAILDQLNLAASNNRAFSISKESKELLRKQVLPNFGNAHTNVQPRFTLVLKDLVRGVPTAYDDLEKLLTNSDDTLQNTYKSMPSWVQELIGKLPTKVTKSIGPELLAAAAEKHGLSTDSLKSAASTAEKAGVKVKIPSLKELVTKQGAIAGLLRTIVNFLRTRFPAVLGVNVLWSVAIFFLLLVLWYCHKRGKEVRLEKERQMTAEEMEALRAQVAADPPADYDPAQALPTTTTAPAGADLAEVRRGVAEVQAARAAEQAAAAAAAVASGPAPEGADTPGARDQLESSLYAPGGSLAASLRAEEEARSQRSVSPAPPGKK